MSAGHRIVVVGGGAAGFFGAITAAEADPQARVVLLEKGPAFLAKVRISGGGRCNVTHACFEARPLTERYPRGNRALIAPFHRFQPRDTVEWFRRRGVELKTEADGRMFPVTDSSQTIIDCLMQAARGAGVQLRNNCGVERLARRDGGGFLLTTGPGETLAADRVLLATGGCRAAAAGALAESLGHTLEPPVPSLFTFHVETPWLRTLPGLSVADVEAGVPEAGLRERGPLLVTHWGLSGPVILRLSAWGARALHRLDYRFVLQVNWLPHLNADQLAAELAGRRRDHPAKSLTTLPLAPLPGRLWEKLVEASGVPGATRWSNLSKAQTHALVGQLARTVFPVTGKSLNKDEFVTCGGVKLAEVDFKTLESRLCPGLHFAGELLDVDGITGGFNFQAAWTTGWLAGQALATGG